MRKVDHEERRDELIAALRQLVAAEGSDVSLRRLIKYLGRSEPHVMAYFDMWGDLREAADLPRRRNRGLSRESVIDALQAAEKKYGQPLSHRRFSHLTGISLGTCSRLFGSWREFREAAGLTEMASAGVPAKYTRDDLVKMMREQIPILGRRISSRKPSAFPPARSIGWATGARSGETWGSHLGAGRSQSRSRRPWGFN